MRHDILIFTSDGKAQCKQAFMLRSDGAGSHWSVVQAGTSSVLSVERNRLVVPGIVPEIAYAGTYRVCDGELKACALMKVRD